MKTVSIHLMHVTTRNVVCQDIQTFTAPTYGEAERQALEWEGTSDGTETTRRALYDADFQEGAVAFIHTHD